MLKAKLAEPSQLQFIGNTSMKVVKEVLIDSRRYLMVQSSESIDLQVLDCSKLSEAALAFVRGYTPSVDTVSDAIVRVELDQR